MDTQTIANTALEIANKYYPDAECVILAGSQLEPDFRTDFSDIDLVIIGTNSLSPTVIEVGNYKVDFTRLGLSNLVDVMMDDSYSHNPRFVNMIQEGMVLKDEIGIGRMAKDYSNIILRRPCFNFINSSIDLHYGLVGLKKNIQKPLDNRYTLFLVGDFIKQITSCHLFLNNSGRYANEGFRQVKMLLKTGTASLFLEELITLGYDFIRDPNAHKPQALKCIENYIDIFQRLENEQNASSRLILNIETSRTDPSLFYGLLCSAILRHPYLSEIFLLGHIHNYKYIFRYKYTLIFMSEAASYNEQKLLNELASLFCELKYPVVDVKKVNPDYAYQLCGDDTIRQQQDKICAIAHRSIVRLVEKDKRYDKDKIFLLSIIIITLVIRAFNFKGKQIDTLFNFLVKKWLLANNLKTVSNEHILYDKDTLDDHFKQVFLKDKSIYDNIKSSLIGVRDIAETYVVEHLEIDSLCSSAVAIAQNITNSPYVLSDLIIHSICVEETTKKEKEIAWYTSHLMEAILDTVGIPHQDRSYFAYVIKQLCHN